MANSRTVHPYVLTKNVVNILRDRRRSDWGGLDVLPLGRYLVTSIAETGDRETVLIRGPQNVSLRATRFAGQPWKEAAYKYNHPPPVPKVRGTDPSWGSAKAPILACLLMDALTPDESVAGCLDALTLANGAEVLREVLIHLVASGAITQDAIIAAAANGRQKD